MTGPRTRHIRNDPEPHGRLLLLRGDLLTPEAIARAADDNLRAFGFPGVSLVAAEADGVEQVLRHRLRRYEWDIIFTATDLISSGVDLWPTGRWPHYDAVAESDDLLVERMIGCAHRVIRNRHHGI